MKACNWLTTRVDLQTTMNVSDIRFYYPDIENCSFKGVESITKMAKLENGSYSLASSQAECFSSDPTPIV